MVTTKFDKNTYHGRHYKFYQILLILFTHSKNKLQEPHEFQNLVSPNFGEEYVRRCDKLPVISPALFNVGKYLVIYISYRY